ncbi:hypothetical protein G9298_29205 (plasmid) [Bacillus thuringiensis]|nr:hypothetical protein G9298_29205 [Bacillus thuringiensis]
MGFQIRIINRPSLLSLFESGLNMWDPRDRVEEMRIGKEKVQSLKKGSGANNGQRL